ncbi:unnamed protein product, partial [Mesorhabditis belari]|uniref:Uncharacterized protein n=1 Tax=Mesorhabditis belari TaxID=2138241 RepID=A0AAF3FF80_9BILA
MALQLWDAVQFSHRESSSDTEHTDKSSSDTEHTEKSSSDTEQLGIGNGVEEAEGFLFHTDFHFTRRRRRDIAQKGRSSGSGVEGLARECGRSCSIRLRGNHSTHIVHLHIFHQLPHSHNRSSTNSNRNGSILPLVQWMSSPNSTTASITKTNPNCVYRAHVRGVSESSVVNLCERHGSLFGLLALPDGVYSVEPLEEEGKKSGKHHRWQPHLIHKFKDHNFMQYDSDRISSPIDSINITYEQFRWDQPQERQRRSRRSATSWDHYVEVRKIRKLSKHSLKQKL